MTDLPTERRAAGRSKLPLRQDWRFRHADQRMPLRPRPHTTPAHDPALRHSVPRAAPLDTQLTCQQCACHWQVRHRSQYDAPALDRRRRPLRARPHALRTHILPPQPPRQLPRSAAQRRRHNCTCAMHTHTHASQAYTNIPWTGRRRDSRQHAYPLGPHAAPRPTTDTATRL